MSSIMLWNHSIFVSQQSYVNDLVATEAVSGPSSIKVQLISCNRPMRSFYRQSHPIDENDGQIFNIGTDS